MNKDIYNRLKPFERYLESAVKTKSVKGLLRADKRVINEIYGEMGYAKLTPGRMICDHCVMTMLENVGTEYFKYKNKYANRGKNDKVQEKENDEKDVDCG